MYWSRKETDTAKPHDLKKEEGRTKTNRLEFLKNDRDQLKKTYGAGLKEVGEECE